jgi:subtilisin family serine protease
MKNWLITAAVIAVATGPVSAGDVTGKVSLEGTPPDEINLPLDPACGASFKKANPGMKPKTRFWVSEKGGLGDVLVVINNIKGGAAPSAAHVIDQRGCEYLPYVSATQLGQSIHVLNSDMSLHNVHPQPRVTGNPEHNRAQLPKGPPLKFDYKNAERFLKFKCDVHPWMYAYVSLVPHQYFAVTKPDGSFSIKGVPAGDYEIEAIHRKKHAAVDYKGVKQRVKVGADGASANFTIKL